MPAGPKLPSIIHPVVDTIAIGGLSIGFLIFLLLVDPGWSQGQLAERFIIFTALLNWPHFMATYALMYRSADTVKSYPWASKWMPLLIAFCCFTAVFLHIEFQFSAVMSILVWVTGGYLAWHYTGQAFGMMATFAFLSGSPIEESERRWIRTGLRLLLAWHVIWYLRGSVFGNTAGISEVAILIYTWATYILIPLGAALGVIGLVQYRKRIERNPSPRVLVPFVAIVLWYSAMAINPIALFWVQLSHALQYLLFPLRVEINRGARKQRSPLQSAVLITALAFGLSLLVFELLPRVIVFTLPVASLAAVKVAISSFINIHHYFADGVLWKISNPAVRKELFAHIAKPEPIS